MIPSGVYTTDCGRQLAYLVNDSDIEVPVRRKRRAARQVPAGARTRCRALPKSSCSTATACAIFPIAKVMFLDDLYTIGGQESEGHPGRFEEEIDKSRPQDVRMLIYTSGHHRAAERRDDHACQHHATRSARSRARSPTCRERRATLLPAALPCARAAVLGLNASLRHGVDGQFRRKPGNGVRQSARGLAACLRRGAAAVGKNLLAPANHAQGGDARSDAGPSTGRSRPD